MGASLPPPLDHNAQRRDGHPHAAERCELQRAGGPGVSVTAVAAA